MPENKMVERKKDVVTGKESKNLNEETDISDTGSTRKEAGFMEEEKQGFKSGEKGMLSHEGSKADVSQGRTGTKESSQDIGERSGMTGGLDTERRLQEEGSSHSTKSHEGLKADVSRGRSDIKDTEKNLEEGRSDSSKSHEGSRADVAHEKKSSDRASSKDR